MRSLIPLLSLFLLALPVGTRAASFDCAKASTLVEKLICSDAEISALDDTLAMLFQAVRKAPGALAAPEPDQRRWLAQRDACSDRYCIMDAYNQRIAELRSSKVAPHSPEPDVHDFAEKLYRVSVYTAEALALRELISAETELVTSRWLAKRLSAQGGRLPAHGPANWEAMSQALGRVVAPIVKMHIRKRARALKAERLGERTAFVRECGRQVRLPQERPNILFMSGGSASGHGDQLDDIPEILAFHETPAAEKWRQLWPQLRAHAARLAALHYRIDADPGLGGSGKSWDERATLLARRIGGRVLTPADWQALTIGRLGFTLSRLDRFLLPLGTEMQQSDAADERSMTIAEQGSAIMITEQEGRGLAFRFLDAGWERDIAHKLSPLELEQIDNALTATYSKTKDRWFAPLELEFEVYLSVSRQIRASTELRAVRQSFARQSDAAMNRAWASWQKRRPEARSSGRQGGLT